MRHIDDLWNLPSDWMSRVWGKELAAFDITRLLEKKKKITLFPLVSSQSTQSIARPCCLQIVLHSNT